MPTYTNSKRIFFLDVKGDKVHPDLNRMIRTDELIKEALDSLLTSAGSLKVEIINIETLSQNPREYRIWHMISDAP